MKRFLMLASLIGSLLLGLAWANYQPGEDDRPHDVMRVPVVVAVEPIPAGTSASEAISSGIVEQWQQDEQFVDDNVVNDLADLSGVSTSDIPEQTTITAEMFD